MLLNLRNQWRDRTYRKAVYQSPRKMPGYTINFAEYDRVASRNETSNQYKKISVPQVDAETLLVKRQTQTFRDSAVSSPLASPKQMVSLNRNSSQKSHRPFYYVEDNEIISVQSFASVYSDMQVFQKQQRKTTKKKEIQEKKKKIEEIQNSFSRPPLCKSLSVSTNDIYYLLPTVSDSNAAVRIDNQADQSETIIPEKRMTISHTPSMFKNPSFLASNQADKTQISSYFKKPGRRYIKGLATDVNEECMTTTTVSDQKLTEKEVNKQFMSVTTSPRPMKSANSSRKEMSFNTMFKDPKTLDSAVENTIRSASKRILRQIGALESHRIPSHPKEAISPLTGTSVDEIDKIDRMSKIRENDLRFTTESVAVTTRGDDMKMGLSLGKKIQKNIKHIDHVLRSSSITLSGLASPKKPSQPKIETVRMKNKLPLRSEIAQKYKLNEKFSDQKRMALKIREITKDYKKSLNGSSMNDQTYLSFYH